MINFIMVLIFGYLGLGLSAAIVNFTGGFSFRLKTIFDWPWLIYIKGETTA